ncbi:hypothetical protein NP233_g3597 [Leucocoprinus birnbaumii]|uniref:Nucleolar protein 9 n=1 Tax=Leucocoprinus birnbaumii TaxID=56174 RepID=A0AAD5YTR0_9AGAR|nr:hypothetical protein NP233_g3597 [Leucocoprinus birnbaumii]
MPRGLRKRGRRNKRDQDDQHGVSEETYPHEVTNESLPQPTYAQARNSEPSWIIPAASQNNDEETNPEAPFGFVDAEIKAYFRTVDVQIRDWQESTAEVEGEDEDTETDPNEERRMFFVAALTEMQGKEKQLATDPDCSIILERMTHSMDDFVRRVFVDSMAGSYKVLARHRFGSHVCQTLFTLARDTIQREIKGIYPQMSGSEPQGELRTMVQLIQDICEELLPSLSALVMDPFGSHVIRSLLALLCPRLAGQDSTQSTLVRSKKSAAWKAKQGPMKSVFDKGKGKDHSNALHVPSGFHEMARRFIRTLVTELDENEVRAMAANKVASPGLQMLLEVEADQGLSDEPGSLMDRVTVGIMSASRVGQPPSEPSDYLNTLLRDTTSSHLLEAIFTRAPPKAFDVLWSLYLQGKLPRLAVHPIANFVVAKALDRADEAQLSGACQELHEVWPRLIASSRSGVLKAVIDRAAKLQVLGDDVVEATLSAFGLEKEEKRSSLVPCALALLSYEASNAICDYNTRKSAPEEQPKYHNRKHEKAKQHSNSLEPQLPGSLLLQSLLQLPEPHCQIVTDSISSLAMEERIQLAQHSISSRIYDAVLSSATISSKSKRAFVMSFTGHYHQLADDRLGSRVADRCWDFADTYLKEKIARSLIPHQQFLASSFYGKFFNRNLNLHLLQRRPDEWRNLQAEKRKKLEDATPKDSSSSQPTKESAVIPSTHQPSATESTSPQPKKKRKRQENEIDALFNASLGKKVKKGALEHESRKAVVSTGESAPVDKGLQEILGAIKLAPNSEKSKSKRSKRS